MDGLTLHVFFLGAGERFASLVVEGVNTGFCIVMHGGVGRGSVRSTGGDGRLRFPCSGCGQMGGAFTGFARFWGRGSLAAVCIGGPLVAKSWRNVFS